jgi:uroporphyrinogen-III synthase
LERIGQTENRSVYISRDANQAGRFISQLENFGFKVIAECPLVTESVELKHIPFTDWVFFTSPSCVEHFFSQDLFVPSVTLVAALGSGTADALKSYGVIPSFTGADGSIAETATAFLEKAKGSEVFFPIGNDSVRSIQQHISDKITVHESIIYRKSPKPGFVMPKTNIAVFTSPAKAEACLNTGAILPHTIVTIGETTASALKKAGVKDVMVSPGTTMQSLADLVCGILI